MREGLMRAQQIGRAISKQEEKMGTIRQLFRFKVTAWSILLLAGLLSGCGLPFIDIDVQVVNTAGACPSGGTRGGPGPELPPGGGCVSETLGAQRDAVQANTKTYTMATTPPTVITAQNTYFCKANTTPCKNSYPGPGTCLQGGVPVKCVTRYTPDSGTSGPGSCNCACTP